MKKSMPIVLAVALIILFFIQSAGTLVESIYILDLMNSTLDEKALGVLFFFTPALLIPLHAKYPRGLAWAVFALLFFSRGLLPHLPTALRVTAAGLGVLASLNLFLLLLKAQPKGRTRSDPGINASIGLALAVLASAALRALDHGVDPSLLVSGSLIGWMLGILLCLLLLQLEWKVDEKPPRKKGRPAGVTGAVLGIILALGLAWFAFSAPAVLARWTEGNYILIVTAVVTLAAGWTVFSMRTPHWPERIKPPVLLAWNLAFTISLTATILVHSVPFPPAPDSPAMTVGAPAWWQHIPLLLMLLLFPVIFADMRRFVDRIHRAAPRPRDLAPGLLLGGLALTLLVFANIFTNVWGYVDPVSPPFRGAFWLTYTLMAAGIAALAWRLEPVKTPTKGLSPEPVSWSWAFFTALGLLFLLDNSYEPYTPENQLTRNYLIVMTFNTQQSNDDFGEKSLEKQLELIRRVSPDVLALQETDSTRISLNNNDYVRYFAENLHYHSYYGPKTVAGTYGTAILSRYPLLNTRTVFTYSDQDEIGTAEAEIEAGGRRITIYNVHPDGSDTAMLAFARDLLARSADDPYMIALGDFNLRDYDVAYQMIDAFYTNAWTSVFPTEIGADGIDMSGDNRIDHIFVSPSLGVRDPSYILPPDSATDHPVHWAEVYWE